MDTSALKIETVCSSKTIASTYKYQIFYRRDNYVISQVLTEFGNDYKRVDYDTK